MPPSMFMLWKAFRVVRSGLPFLVVDVFFFEFVFGLGILVGIAHCDDIQRHNVFRKSENSFYGRNSFFVGIDSTPNGTEAVAVSGQKDVFGSG